MTHVRNGFFASLRTYEHSRNDGSDQIRNEQILMSRVVVYLQYRSIIPGGDADADADAESVGLPL